MEDSFNRFIDSHELTLYLLLYSSTSLRSHSSLPLSSSPFSSLPSAPILSIPYSLPLNSSPSGAGHWICKYLPRPPSRPPWPPPTPFSFPCWCPWACSSLADLSCSAKPPCTSTRQAYMTRLHARPTRRSVLVVDIHLNQTETVFVHNVLWHSYSYAFRAKDWPQPPPPPPYTGRHGTSCLHLQHTHIRQTAPLHYRLYRPFWVSRLLGLGSGDSDALGRGRLFHLKAAHVTLNGDAKLLRRGYAGGIDGRNAWIGRERDAVGHSVIGHSVISRNGNRQESRGC